MDSGLGRVNVAPQLRYPFKKWQWFTVNSTLGWRDTYYTRSLDPNDPSIPVDVPINRQFFTVQSQITGPVFNRVWDTPDNGYAEKFKHTIEPFLNVMYTSGTNDINQIIQFDGIDSAVAGTQLTYGLNNRFFAKRSQTPGAPAQSREIIDVSLTQSYYNNPVASIYDHQYQTTGLRRREQLFADRAERPGAADQRLQRDGQRGNRFPLPRTAHHFGAGQLHLDQPLPDHDRLEQEGLHRRAVRLRHTRLSSTTTSTRRSTYTPPTTKSARSTTSTTMCCTH